MALIYLSSAWVAGIFLGSKVDISPFFILTALVPLPLLFLANQHKKEIILSSLCIAVFFGGSFYYQIRIPSILVAGDSLELSGWVGWLRNRMSEVLAQVLPEPQASLAQGIVLGIRSNIPASIKTAFNNSGTAHLLAISGMNLTIIAGILTAFGTTLLGRRYYLYIWLALVTIWFYSLLTGMQPPVIRAAIMASLFLVADLLGRQRSAATALFFAAAVMITITPHILWDSPSFQMSFMSMVGLIFVYPPIRTIGRKAFNLVLSEDSKIASAVNFLIDSFSVSLGAVIAVWPLIAYWSWRFDHFAFVSWVGPLATFFALPALAPAIILGFMAGISGLLFIPLAQVIAWFAWLFLSYVLLIAKVFTLIPPVKWSSFDIPSLFTYYAVLAFVIWLNSNRKKVLELMPKVVDFMTRLPKKWVVSPLLVVAILVWTTFATLPDNKLHVSFLDVGQGDAILIQRGSQQFLIDGGPSPQSINFELGKEMPFWDRTIEMIILTHPHSDHLAGLLEVLNRYKVEQVLNPDSESESSLYKEWLRLVKEEGSIQTQTRAGQQITLGEVTVEVLGPLNPPLADTESDIDNNGVVLRLKMGSISFLFTADIMWEDELELINQRLITRSTVLKVAHHGSATSTTDEFLAMVDPTIGVISVGEKNTFGHPSGQVLGRLKEKLGEKNIFRTDKGGTIEFITDGERLWVKAKN